MSSPSAVPPIAKNANPIEAIAVESPIMLEDLNLVRRIFDSVSNGITVCDASQPDLPLVYVNPAFEKLTGYSAEESCGRNCRFLQGSHNDQPGIALVKQGISEQREVRVVLKNIRKDGSLFWNELYLSPVFNSEGRLTHFVGIQNDVTAQVDANAQLDHLAHHDTLTGLANRALLIEHLSQALHRVRRSGATLAVLFLDLDSFKHVNDVFGHDAGDSLLQIVGSRLRNITRAHETVARLGGDEFVVVLEDFSDERQLADVVRRNAKCISEPIELLGQIFAPSASVGVALFPQDGDTPEALLKAADFNMYLAKHEARYSTLHQQSTSATSQSTQ